MMSPASERQRLISEAVGQATHLLGSPVDFVRVEDDVVEVGAGQRRLRGKYGYSDGSDGNGHILLGGGHWWVAFGKPEDKPASWIGRFLGARRR
jgi:hypothetical protein